MSRQQIGLALEYKDPRVAIAKIHDANKERLDRDSVVTKLETLMENLILVIFIMNVVFMKFVEEVDNPS